ncbi:MAG TPA: hypothetical protein VGG75_36100 [Trebonia sp.]|jgi:hypothetical protein
MSRHEDAQTGGLIGAREAGDGDSRPRRTQMKDDSQEGNRAAL